MSSNVQAVVDRGERTATITTVFRQPIDAVWRLWSDPVKLARWWGPPGVPMTVDHHDLVPGGSVDVTVSAAGGVIRGHWSVTAVDPPSSLCFVFSSDGIEPTQIDVLIEPGSETTTTMTVTVRFGSDADLDRAIQIGFVDGVVRSCQSAQAVL
jgi:uncharacterized protein YndB with AHSA1/START domain